MRSLESRAFTRVKGSVNANKNVTASSSESALRFAACQAVAVVALVWSGLASASDLPRLAAKYFAQTHVIDLDDQNRWTVNNGAMTRSWFPVLADREMLFKANFVSDDNFRSTDITATLYLYLGGERLALEMDPPTDEFLPAHFEKAEGKVVHQFDDSFTVSVPANWVKPGLKWELGWCVYSDDPVYANCRLEEKRSLSIGPRVKFHANFFAFRFFNFGMSEALVDNFVDELSQRLPVSDFIVRRPKVYHFPQILVPAHGGHPPRIVSSSNGSGELSDWSAPNGARKGANQNDGRPAYQPCYGHCRQSQLPAKFWLLYFDGYEVPRRQGHW